MNHMSKTLNRVNLKAILEKVIANDPALAGFTPDSLPEAAKARVARELKRGSLDREHEESEIRALENWSDEHWKKSVFREQCRV
jgi:hypothetical protein